MEFEYAIYCKVIDFIIDCLQFKEFMKMIKLMEQY